MLKCNSFSQGSLKVRIIELEHFYLKNFSSIMEVWMHKCNHSAVLSSAFQCSPNPAHAPIRPHLPPGKSPHQLPQTSNPLRSTQAPCKAAARLVFTVDWWVVLESLGSVTLGSHLKCTAPHWDIPAVLAVDHTVNLYGPGRKCKVKVLKYVISPIYPK